LSYRQAAYDEWPRSGIPDFFENEAQYATLAQRLITGGAMKDASFLWWAIRPSAHYPTLELRIADACTHQVDTLALAAVYRASIAFLVRNPDYGREYSAITRRVIDENRWRAKRYGPQAEFIDDESGAVKSAAAALQELRELLRREAAEFGCTSAFDRLDEVRETGASAHRQLEIYATHRASDGRIAALKRVVDWLADQTTAVEAREAPNP
jgi:glutamate---cysteine ligase / carboxylate-amine ligase